MRNRLIDNLNLSNLTQMAQAMSAAPREGITLQKSNNNLYLRAVVSEEIARRVK